MTVRSIVAVVFVFVVSGPTAGLAETRMMSDPSGAIPLAAPAGAPQCCSTGAPSVADASAIDGVPLPDQVAAAAGVDPSPVSASDVTIPLGDSARPSFVARLLTQLAQLVGAGSR